MRSLCGWMPVDKYHVSAVNTLFSIPHVIFLPMVCGCSILFTKRITTTRLKLLLSQYRRESSFLPQCNLLSPTHTQFTWNITSILKIKGCSECMLYSRTASVGNMPLCVTAEKERTFGIELSKKTLIITGFIKRGIVRMELQYESFKTQR
jgi:hypothetical protein